MPQLGGNPLFYLGVIVGKIRRSWRSQPQPEPPVENEEEKLRQLLTSMQAFDLLPSARTIALIVYFLSRNGSNVVANWTDEATHKIAEYAGVNKRHTYKMLAMLENCGIVVSFSRFGNTVFRRINFSEEGRFDFNPSELVMEELVKIKNTKENQVLLDRKEIEFGAFDLVDEFKSRWLKKYETPCHFTGKDRDKAFELVKTLGVDESLHRLNKYLEDDSEWLRTRSHPFAAFCSMSNQYRSKDAEAKIAKHEEFDREVRRNKERIARRRQGGDALAQRGRTEGSKQDL